MKDFLYKTVPMKHQKDAETWSYEKDFFAYFMEQGVGKTKTTIDVASNWFLDGIIDAVITTRIAEAKKE